MSNRNEGSLPNPVVTHKNAALMNPENVTQRR